MPQADARNMAGQINPDPYPMAEVYDVSQDKWLGALNGYKFMTQGHSVKDAIVVKLSGEMVTVGKAAKALRHARTVCASAEASTKESEMIFEISMELRFQDKIKEKNDAFFKSLPVGGLFVTFEMDGKYEPCIFEKMPLKVWGNKPKRGSGFYPHRGVNDKKDGTSYWLERPANTLFLTAEMLDEWKDAIQVEMAKADLDSENYNFSVGSINDELLRIAHAIGGKAKAHPFDIEKCCGFVKIGAWKINLIQNSGDMMDIVIENEGKTLACREDLVSVRMAHHANGGMFGRTYTFSEIGARAYADFQLSKKLKS